MGCPRRLADRRVSRSSDARARRPALGQWSPPVGGGRRVRHGAPATSAPRFPHGLGRTARPPTVDHAGSGGERAEASERLEERRVGGFRPGNTRRSRGGRRRTRGGRRSPSTNSAAAAGATSTPAARPGMREPHDELGAGPRETSRAVRNRRGPPACPSAGAPPMTAAAACGGLPRPRGPADSPRSRGRLTPAGSPGRSVHRGASLPA